MDFWKIWGLTKFALWPSVGQVFAAVLWTLSVTGGAL